MHTQQHFTSTNLVVRIKFAKTVKNTLSKYLPYMVPGAHEPPKAARRSV